MSKLQIETKEEWLTIGDKLNKEGRLDIMAEAIYLYNDIKISIDKEHAEKIVEQLNRVFELCLDTSVFYR